MRAADSLPNPEPRPPEELARLERAWSPPRGWRVFSESNNTHVGRWYVGERGLGGMLVRAMGAALVVQSTQLTGDPGCAYARPEDHCQEPASVTARDVVLFGGLGLIAVGTAYDLIEAYRGAGRWNRRHQVQIAPTVVSAGGASSIPAMRPISVCIPVAVTMAVPRP